MSDAPDSRLLDTREAFDSVAADYDGLRGNNESIQEMRSHLWACLDQVFPGPARLIDLGCGTGLDAVRMAHLRHDITATDWSPRMVERTRERAREEGLVERVEALDIGAHELERLPGVGTFDGAYSNLGPLNCVPDLRAVSLQCARLLKPGGRLVFSVIGRLCPWEIAHYVGKGKWSRARIRFARSIVPVSMNQRTIWTRYYFPRELYSSFRREFTLEHHHGLCLFAPPPYLTWVRERHPQLFERLWRLDSHLASWPLLRAMGDHFVIVMSRRRA